ncbi:Aldehyde dehydrogenase, dimeric NADP-preferring [Mortierella claussenii]|nr:Aldehyde dehydrogenase, dimeric NADP-preferring [Mortierella claussenii]
MTIEYTPVSDIPKIVDRSRAFFRTHKTQPLEFRKEQLGALKRLVSENTDDLNRAIEADLNRGKNDEVATLVKSCDNFINNLEELTKDRKADGLKDSDDSYVRLSPLGTVLIIAPWNFPIGLVLEPLAGALAAGNNAVVKLSEMAENASRLLTHLISKYFDPQVVAVINGNHDQTTEVLKQRFDHIFYTGGADVGKVVMTAASKNLTPVTLELGGKCPVIVTENTDLKKAAEKIAFWKLYNCGQVCITVDYVLIPKKLQDKFVEAVIAAWKRRFGEDISQSDAFPRIINKKHHERLQKVLESVSKENKIEFGGRHDSNKRFVEPTVVVNVTPKDEIMKNEIFGPIMPIVNYDNLDAAIDVINDREHALALYMYSDNKDQIEKVLRETRSGGVVINDIGCHYGNHNLPFGGVGHSGIGNYHGKYSIDTFSHHRSVMNRNLAHL